jgi:LSD1 subclass zinc finger protein
MSHENGSTGTFVGSCHCGAVKYEVQLDLAKGASRCNCSICQKVGAVGAIVKPAAFRLLAGEGELSEYVWGHKISRRFFCRKCGVHCFARGHLDVLGGDYVSVNLNTLDDADIAELKLGHWDGRHDNWAAGMRDKPWPIFAASV